MGFDDRVARYRSACVSDRSGKRSSTSRVEPSLVGHETVRLPARCVEKGTVVTQQNVTVAVTGAGGTGVAKALLAALQQDDRVGHINLLVSANGRKLLNLNA